jgi:dTDP-4-amino-4,6-dideoxygalactose transaminase
MVVLAGGEPVFVDSRPRSTNVDIDHLETLVSGEVACVLITHYHVNQNEFGIIKGLCERREIRLFEDCAISLSGTIDGRHVGTESDGGILSLSGFKSLNYFWGGCVLSQHDELIESLSRETRGWNRLTRRDYLPQVLKTLQYDVATRRFVFDVLVFPLLLARQRKTTHAVNLSPPRIESSTIDHTLRSLPSGSALAEWNSKFHKLDAYLSHRRGIASIYDEYLGERMVSAESSASTRAGSCFVNYPVYVGPSSRDAVYKALMFAGYDVGASLYPNCHRHQSFERFAGRSSNVDDLVRGVITLPTHPKVDERYARRLATTVAKAINETGALEGRPA